MGANFIGWHAKGPAQLEITEAQIQELANQLTPVARWWSDLGEGRESIYFDHLDRCELPITPEAADQPDFVDSFMAALAHDSDDASLRNHIRELVANTLAHWPPDFRDVSCVTDPDDPSDVIVFAGDRNWGDEPYGNGYLAMRMLAQTGIGTAVGIKLLEGFVTLTLPRSDGVERGRLCKKGESFVGEPAKLIQSITEDNRTKLLRELYQTVLQQSESFEEQHFGNDLAYLMGAILEDSYCDWPTDRPLVQVLRRSVSQDHAVWSYVRIAMPRSGPVPTNFPRNN